MADNFALPRQRKVTKEARSRQSARERGKRLLPLGATSSGGARAGWGERSESQRRVVRWLLGFAALTPTYAHRVRTTLRRPSDVFGIPGEPGVQPRVKRCGVAMSTGGDKSDARAQRLASAGQPFGCCTAQLVHVVLVCGSGPLLW